MPAKSPEISATVATRLQALGTLLRQHRKRLGVSATLMHAQAPALQPSPVLLNQAVAKAAAAYGGAIIRDLDAAIQGLLTRSGWLERCMQAMDISVPKAVLWKKIRTLQARLGKLGASHQS